MEYSGSGPLRLGAVPGFVKAPFVPVANGHSVRDLTRGESFNQAGNPKGCTADVEFQNGRDRKVKDNVGTLRSDDLKVKGVCPAQGEGDRELNSHTHCQYFPGIFGNTCGVDID
jgi:hypothetical protein